MQRKKMTKFASPTKDSTFKLIFGQDRHKNLTIDFLNNFLGRTAGNLINEISFMNQEQTPKNLLERKSILDIHCKDQTGNQFIIEMQAGRENFFIARALYYAACLLSRQLDKEDLFTDLKQVIVIGILDYTLLDTDNQAISHHLITDINNGKQSTNLIELHFIELTKFNKSEDDLETQTDKWIFFLKNAHKLSQIPDSCQNSSQIIEAFHLMEQNSWSPTQIAQYESDMMNFKKNITHDYVLLEEGRQEGLEQTAINMLKENLPIDVIARITGLSQDRIVVLQKNVKNIE